MRIRLRSFVSIDRFHIFLVLLVICILMLIIEAIFPKSLSNHLLSKKAISFFDHKIDDSDVLERFKDYEADSGDLLTKETLPFTLDGFGDYEPIFLARKVIHLQRKMNKNEKYFSMNLKKMRDEIFKKRMKFDSKQDIQKKYLKLMKKHNPNGNYFRHLINEVEANKLSINQPALSSTSYLINGSESSSKQTIMKRHMFNPLNLLLNQKKNFKFNNRAKIIQSDPISILKFAPKDVTKINRIYLLSYFRSGSSFLGDLLQQNFRTFYQFEPLHFKSVASRLPSNNTKSDASIAFVVHMINECNFHSNTSKKYLNWISKEANKFLLTWNHFLYSLCRYNQTKCSDENFVKQVCDLADQRVTKLTRVYLYDLIKVLNKKSSKFEQYIQINTKLNLLDQIKNANNQTDLTINSEKLINNSISIPMLENNSINVEPIKIIYLVRDPRAIYSSRQNLSWCKTRVSCASIDSLCKEMNKDFQEFETLHSKYRSDETNRINLTNSTRYPIQLFLVRFETVAIDPLNSSDRLFKLLNLPFTNNIRRFVFTHTASSKIDNKNMFKTQFENWYLKKLSSDPHSTQRNSTKIPFDWVHKLNWSKIDEIQTKCKPLMDKLGYKTITNKQFKNITNIHNEHLSVLFEQKNKFTLF